MRSAAIALNWEFGRRVWFWLLLTLAYFLGLPLFLKLVFALLEESVDLGDDYVTLPLHLIHLGGTLLGVGVMVWQAQLNEKLILPSRVFALPIPTWLLAACHSLQGIVTISAFYAVTTLAYRLWFGVAWPVFGPIVFLSTSMVCWQAIHWSWMDFRFWKLIPQVAVMAAFVDWIGRRYSMGATEGASRFWTTVTIPEFLTLAACSVAAFGFVVRGMARCRRGDALGAAMFWKWCERLVRFIPRGRPAYRSAEDAHLWHEWQLRGLPLPVVVGVLPAGSLLFFVVAAAWDGVSRREISKALEGICGMAVALPCILPLAFAARAGQKLSYNAILPVSDRAFARVVLRNSFNSVVASWAVAAVLVSFAVAWVAIMGDPATVIDDLSHEFRHRPAHWGVWYFVVLAVALFLVSWTTMAVSTSLFLTGRPWVYGAVAGTVFGFLLTSAVFLNEKVLGRELFGLTQTCLLLGAGIVGVVGTAWAFVTARRRDLITIKTAVAAAAAWVALSAGLLLLVPESPVRPVAPAAVVFAIGLLTLPAAPFALAPLALAWNRHR